MTILLLYHFGTFRNFKQFYMHFIKVHLAQEFPTAVSYNRFVELEGRVFFHMMFFLNLRAFGSCTELTEATVGAETVGNYAFTVCSKLKI